MSNYSIKDFIGINIDESRHWHKDVNHYYDHLIHVLSRAFEISFEDLINNPELFFLRDLKDKYNNLRTPISGFLESSASKTRFPILIDINNSCLKQSEAIIEIFIKIIGHYHPSKVGKVFSKEDLLKYGYESNLEPDYTSIYDDY